MAQLEEILGKKINSVKELRSEIKRLQDSLVGVDAESEQFKTTSQQLAAAQDELRKVTRASTDDNLAAKDSIVGMQQEYKKLYDQYKLLSDEQRNSPFGKNMAESLNTLSQKLNDTKKDVGNFKDNIGRYAGDVTQVFQTMGISIGSLQTPMKLAAGGAKTLGAALKSLIANPVGAAIMAIVVAFKAFEAIAKKVKEAINNNEESQMRLSEAMASFRPIIDAVGKAFDWLGQKVVQIIEFYGKLVDGVRKVTTAITDFLGITKGANDRTKEQINTYKDLAKAQNDLTKTKREYQKLNASDTAEVERLREEASETQNLVEKKKLLEEAKAKQGEIDARNVEIANEELRILQVQNKLTPNAAADNDKLAAAIARVSQAEADAARNARQFNKQLNTVTNATKSAGVATEDYRKKAKDLYKQLVEENKTEFERLNDTYKDQKKLLEKYHLDTTLLTRKYENEKSAIVQKSLEKQRQMRLNEIKYEKEANERLRATLSPLQQIDFDIDKANKTIEKLQKIRDEVAKKIEEAFNSDPLEFAPPSKSIAYVDEAIESVKQFEEKVTTSIEEKRKQFEDWFKEYFSDENSVFVWPYDKIKELFDEVGAITGEDIIDVESIDLVIKIIQNKIASLNDVKIDTKIGFQLNEQLAEYYQQLIKVSEDEEISAEERNVKLTTLDNALLFKRRDLLKQELDNFKGSQELKLQIMQEYYAVLEELDGRHQEREELLLESSQKLWEARFDTFEKLGSSINTVTSSYASLIQAEVNSGKITKKEADKKKKTLESLQKIQLAVNIAGIAATTASGIMDIWGAFAAEKRMNSKRATDPATLAILNGKALASAILHTTGLALTAAANIAAARNSTISNIRALSDSDVSVNDVAATPQIIDSTPYTYTRTLQTQEEEDEMNRPIYVTVTDIEDGLKNKVTVTNESSF